MQNGYFSFPQFQMTHSERRESVLIALLTLNDSRFLKGTIENIADPRVYINKGISIEEVVNYLNELLIFDGYKLQKKDLRYKVVKVKTTQKNKPKSKSAKGGRPRDPTIKERNKNINSDYYRLTVEEEYTRNKAIKLLSEEYALASSTIEKYIK